MASMAKEHRHTPPAQQPTAAAGALSQARPPARSFTVTVVIPAKNEAENLPYVLPLIPYWIDEVLLVDGCSTDGTAEVARRLRPDVRIIEQQGQGKGAALRAGFAAAKGDIIVMMDADGSTDPGEILRFVGALLAGADFAKGTRFIQGAGTADMTPIRRLGNWALLFLVRRLFGGRYSDLCYGYNAFWRRVLPVLNLTSNGFEIETEMSIRVLRAGLKVAEVPSFEAARLFGTSHLNAWRDGWRVLRTILVERARPHHVAVLEASEAGVPQRVPAEHSLLYFDPRGADLHPIPVRWDGTERRGRDRRTAPAVAWDGLERRRGSRRRWATPAATTVTDGRGGFNPAVQGAALE